MIPPGSRASRPTVPFGAWPSPLAPAAMGTGNLRLASAQLTERGLCWLEGRPSDGGRTVLVCRPETGELVDLVPPPFDVRSRVHEYGGGAYTFGEGDEVFFVNASDQAVYRHRPGERPQPLSPGGPEWRF